MTPQCHGEWLLWRAAEGLPHPDDGDHAAAAEELAEEYTEEITTVQNEKSAHRFDVIGNKYGNP
jgi:hypothetical protein